MPLIMSLVFHQSQITQPSTEGSNSSSYDLFFSAFVSISLLIFKDDLLYFS